MCASAAAVGRRSSATRRASRPTSWGVRAGQVAQRGEPRNVRSDSGASAISSSAAARSGLAARGDAGTVDVVGERGVEPRDQRADERGLPRRPHRGTRRDRVGGGEQVQRREQFSAADARGDLEHRVFVVEVGSGSRVSASVEVQSHEVGRRPRPRPARARGVRALGGGLSASLGVTGAGHDLADVVRERGDLQRARVLERLARARERVPRPASSRPARPCAASVRRPSARGRCPGAAASSGRREPRQRPVEAARPARPPPARQARSRPRRAARRAPSA